MDKILTLKKFQQTFNTILRNYILKKKTETQNAPPIIRQSIERISQITLSCGKRIRPSLVYYGYTACGGKSFVDIKNYCLAIELFETFALIHDDIIDKSPKRRGVETIHTYFGRKFKNPKLGQSIALLCGDLVFSWVDTLFHSNTLTAKNSHLQNIFSKMKEQVVYGQLIDTLGAKSEKEAVLTMQWKTASYSSIAPLAIGAIIGNAYKAQIETLSKYGLHFGLAFQLQDDILGIFGKEKDQGKSTLDDLREGKRNLLYFATMKRLKAKEKREFQNIWGSKTAETKELERIRFLMKNCGAPTDIIYKLTDWRKKALKALEIANIEKEAKRQLRYIIEKYVYLEKDHEFRT